MVVRNTPVYTAILLTGLIATTFQDPLTPIVTMPLAVTGDALVSLVNLSQESFAIPESIVNFVDRFDPVQTHILVPLS